VNTDRQSHQVPYSHEDNQVVMGETNVYARCINFAVMTTVFSPHEIDHQIIRLGNCKYILHVKKSIATDRADSAHTIQLQT
jgi:hypothetical protein